jgi:hypothetical protein
MKNLTNEELVSYFIDCVEFPDDKNVFCCQTELLSRLNAGEKDTKKLEKLRKLHNFDHIELSDVDELLVATAEILAEEG